MTRVYEFLEGNDGKLSAVKLGEVVGVWLCAGLAVASFIQDRSITMELVYSVLTLAGVRGLASTVATAVQNVKIEQARQGIQPAPTVVTAQPSPVTVNTGAVSESGKTNS
jgi:hypothetical protein